LTNVGGSVNVFASDYQLRIEILWKRGWNPRATAARWQRPEDSTITPMSALFIVAATVCRANGRIETAEIEGAC
jgi:hypothetical protein